MPRPRPSLTEKEALIVSRIPATNEPVQLWRLILNTEWTQRTHATSLRWRCLKLIGRSSRRDARDCSPAD